MGMRKTNLYAQSFEVTPIQRLNEKLNNNTFYIKRDDLLLISFGGNKARKAVLFFEDLEINNFNCVVTYGTSSSNHCRIVANIAAAMNVSCHIISPYEASKPTINNKIIKLFDAKITQFPVCEVNAAIDKKMDKLKAEGYKPYFIQGGGHGNIGTQAYVTAYQEILVYEKINSLHFDYIFHASGTGTTQAGLVCGKIINNDKREIVGVSIARKNPYGGQVVCDSVNRYLKGKGKNYVSTKTINFVDDYVLEGYGAYNNDILQTIKSVIVNSGIPMDTIYTGKAFWGMKEYIKKNGIKGKTILFVHTGGTPQFFDDLKEL